MRTRFPSIPFTVCFAFATALALAPLADAKADQSPEPRLVVITGQHTVRIPATRAQLTASAEMQAESPASAQQAVRDRSRTVLDFLQRSQVDRLQAGALALYPVYGEAPAPSAHDAHRGPVVVGYRAQWTASFEVAAERAGEVADGLVQAGAARIASFEFIATDDELAGAQRAALRGAAQRAREDAHAVLDALGYEARDVVRIDVNSNGPVQPFARSAKMMTFAGNQDSTAVEPGMVEVNGSVTLQVSY